MQDANDQHFRAAVQVVDGVTLIERHAEPSGKMESLSPKPGEMLDVLEMLFKASNKMRRHAFRCFAGDVGPDLNQIGFGGLR